MARKAGDGSGTPQRYNFVDRIQVTWQDGAAAFDHASAGVYKLA
jgi:hypothetical protein